MITPRTTLTILGRSAVALSVAVGGTLLTAAPAIAAAPAAIHGAYGEDPYGEGTGIPTDDPYATTTTMAPTTTTTIFATTTTTMFATTTTTAARAAVEGDPIVEGAGLGSGPGVAVAPASETAPEVHGSLPRTGSAARTQAIFASLLVAFGTALRAVNRKRTVKA